MRSLTSLATKNQISDGLLLHLIIDKVDTETQSAWHQHITLLAQKNNLLDVEGSTDFLPEWDDFSSFLEQRCQAFEFIEANRTHQFSI